MRTLAILLVIVSTSWADFRTTTLFEADTSGYAVYRIPGVVVTSKGSLLAYCEARKTEAGDWGKIDLLFRRSADGGKTWSPARPVVEIGTGFEKNPVAVKQKLGKPGDITANNPVAIVDGNIVHFVYCIEYMRCFYARSDDDGQTWSKPVEITKAFESFRPQYDWKVLATGPGHGIAHSKTGRLIVPVWLSTGEGGHAHRPSAVAVIYSDDHGATWKAGDFVVKHPELANPSETAAVELPDGRVLLNIRHESAPHFRATSISPNGATGWSKPERNLELPEPICMGSLERFGDRLLFSNPHNTLGRERRHVTIHVSSDAGKTWPNRRTVDSGLSGYSDLAVGKDGRLHCFYERCGAGNSPGRVRRLVLASFDESWMTQPVRRIVCLGDSITKGYRPGVNDDDAFPALVEAGLRQKGMAVDVLNVGIGGETSTAGLARLSGAVLAQKPQMVTIMYGANDSYIDKGKSAPRVSLDQYRQNLLEIVKQVKAVGAEPILMTTNRYGDRHAPDGAGKHPNGIMAEYMEVCREVARTTKCTLIDHQQAWIDSAKSGVDIEKWMTDSVHPNKPGHADLAQRIISVLSR